MRVKEEILAERIVRAARYMVGAPYRHQARAGRDGVDCVGLLICVGDAVDAQVADDRTYTRETDGALLLRILRSTCSQVEGESFRKGDIVVFKRGRRMWHTGIIVQEKPTRMVHAWSRYTNSTVREEELSGPWVRAIHSVWRYMA